MKRASDVPPVVDSIGVRPVTSVMALLIISTNGPGVVTNTSELDGSQSMCQRMRFPAASRARRSTSARSSSRARVSLKRMLKRARLRRNEIDGLVADIDRGELEVRGAEMRGAGIE